MLFMSGIGLIRGNLLGVYGMGLLIIWLMLEVVISGICFIVLVMMFLMWFRLLD